MDGITLSDSRYGEGRHCPDSIELTPQQITGDAVGLINQLPAGCEVFIPFLPKADFSASVRASEQLTHAGLTPVPHVAARAFTSEAELARAFADARHAGVSSLFLVAGDITRPAGPFASSLDVLRSGLIQEYGFDRLGFAAYPQGHPKVSQTELDRALEDKLAAARKANIDCFLVTQFGFSVEPVAQWLRKPVTIACNAPVRIGIPGPASVRALMLFAMQCGVVASARALSGRPDARAAWLGGWRPDELVESLVTLRCSQAGQSPGGDFRLHWFAFGGLKRTLASMREPDWQPRVGIEVS